MRVIKTASYRKSSMRKWNDVEGSIQVSSDELEGDIGDAIRAKLPEQDRGNFTVDISFMSSGYDEPGSMYGGRDHMGWAPEGEDIREVTKIEIGTDTMVYPLPTEDPMFDQLVGLYQGAIDRAELDTGAEQRTPDDDPPDRGEDMFNRY